MTHQKRTFVQRDWKIYFRREENWKKGEMFDWLIWWNIDGAYVGWIS